METPTPSLNITVPLETEVLREHRGMVTGTSYTQEQGIIAAMDVRQISWRKLLGLPRGRKVHWADVRTVEIQELSALPWAITYTLTYGDGWYLTSEGRREYFPLQKHLVGIDLDRQCTVVALRAAVLLAVMGGVGLRCVCWLMNLLFHLNVSKSSLDRWVKECAARLPDAVGMAKVLHSDKPITEAHFDEIFAKGQRPKRCTVVLRDEHGRIFAAREMEERTKESVSAFLTEVKGWGLALKAFYVDGCEAYRSAIGDVFPDAVVQYDYFHVIQSIWRKLWKAVVARRKDLKARGEAAETPAYSARLLSLAKRIWENRYLFFKRDENLAEKEREELPALMEEDPFLAKVRGFVKGVWGIFQDSTTEEEATLRLAALKLRPEVEPGSAFAKAIAFLEGRFPDMVAFLRHPTVKRNSLAETGIRCLRRLEQGHDGFRGAAGLDSYLRLYQAIKYCGWAVHRFTPELGLPTRDPWKAPEVPGPADTPTLCQAG